MIIKRLIVVLFTLACAVSLCSCDKVSKWQSSVEDRKQAAEDGLAQRREYLEYTLSPESRAMIPDDFYTYNGYRDWWRIPLVFPYQVMCIDTMESGSLERYDPSYPVADPNKSTTTILNGIRRLNTDNRFLLIEQQDESQTVFAIIEYTTGRQSDFTNEESMWEAATNRGFIGQQILLKVEAMYTRYYNYRTKFAEQAASCNPLPAAEFRPFFGSMNPNPVCIFRPSW